MCIVFVIAMVAFSGCMESKTESYDDAAWLNLYNQSSEKIDSYIADIQEIGLGSTSKQLEARDKYRELENFANSTLAESKEYRVSPELESAKEDYEIALVKFAAFASNGRQGIGDLLAGKERSAALSAAITDFSDALAAKTRSESKIRNLTSATAEKTTPTATTSTAKKRTLTEEQKELAITSIEGYTEVQDAAITQDGDQLSLAIIVPYGTNEETAKDLGDSFVRLVKTFGPEEAPGKEIGPGIYDYLVGVYYPNGDTVALGAKVSNARAIHW
ncbi:MAG: hypothetical protein A4E51_00218 [Methanosaeta sp. PtaU1.Bin055]|nr:MAG: hypothetical protein A4E51_00218 [Methanosaeta sp. PtaU1.Bin055]